MINENIIVRVLDGANRQKQQYKERYERCTKYDRETERNAYIKALDIYSARYQMLLLFGYDVVSDENNNIIGIKKI